MKRSRMESVHFLKSAVDFVAALSKLDMYVDIDV